MIRKVADELYQACLTQGLDVLLDDRDERVAMKAMSRVAATMMRLTAGSPMSPRDGRLSYQMCEKADNDGQDLLSKVPGTPSEARVSRSRPRIVHLALAAETATEHTIRCGQLLIEAKDGLAHGQWLPWIKDHCVLSERCGSPKPRRPQ